MHTTLICMSFAFQSQKKETDMHVAIKIRAALLTSKLFKYSKLNYDKDY